MREIAVARLVKVRGNRGELLAESLTSFPERFAKLDRVTLDKNGVRREFRVDRVWFHDGRPVFGFEGIDSIGAAEPWAGADVRIPESQRMPLGEGEYYVSDLVGCEVRLLGTGERAGTVEDAIESAGRWLLEIGGGALIPFVPAICPRVDAAARVIWIDPPEGLLDLAK